MTAELILIVEDHEVNRRMARDLLGVHGYRTMEAESGEEALALCEQAEPDLVLMDIHLPGINGIETLARLRPTRTRAVPVVAFTASVMPEDRSQIVAAGFDAFVAKPIDIHSFIETIRALLARPAG
ncbi:response regulator [Aromatoleum diolicum]|uniref:Response regulator n=1 Tax=Aromatoleum diolicum TaxID=75796 RepID=A0ABX1QH00_9RHOO|nr:response regulator [Aromatoleum diolicum]NMG77218.1 response regulator [Aromatoleum diolicum]